MSTSAGYQTTYQPCIDIEFQDGKVLVGSDSHIWPGKPSTAMRAFIKFAKEHKPKAIVLNGDVLDFPRISRHPRIGWQGFPTPQEEIEAAQDQLSEIEQSAGRGVHKIWNGGNHDIRFSSKLANAAPDYAYVRGAALEDHFPAWAFAWSCEINGVIVKHRWKGGRHAPLNNTIEAGRSIITGHLHSQQVACFTDRNGARWGVDAGCLAETSDKCFIDYTENSPKNWRAGFCVLTFVKGVLLPPELVTVWGYGQVVFRGQVIRV